MENTNINNLKGQGVLIVGLGRSGMACVDALRKLGCHVMVQDSKAREDFSPQEIKVLEDKVEKMFLACVPTDWSEIQIMVLSPGVDPTLPFINDARAHNVEVIGELEIAYRLTQGTFVAITGTNGKTTTTTLVGEIFRKAHRKTQVVGNIGVAVISKALKAAEDEWLITETSSFQLETTKYFKPKAAAVLNLTEDHLNRHKTMECYGDAKAKIVANVAADDYLVVNYEDDFCKSLGESTNCKVMYFSSENLLIDRDYAIYVTQNSSVEGDKNSYDLSHMKPEQYDKDGEGIVIKCQGKKIYLMDCSEIKLVGKHNLENIMAAAALAYLCGINPEDIREAISDFKGVEHRIEPVSTIDDVSFYNDSKGTNTDATITALKALKNNIILIAGGEGKGQDFNVLAPYIKSSVKTLIVLGKDGDKIKEVGEAVGVKTITTSDIGEAVKLSFKLACKGDKVLLSPACASWDMYDSYEQRGKHFKDCVAMLNEK